MTGRQDDAPPCGDDDPAALTGIAELTVVRHGQSLANAAFAAALAAGRAETGLVGPDAEIDLSPLGRAQASAVGRHLAALPPTRRPQVVVCSPYLRARRTWQLAVAAAHHQGVRLPQPVLDGRLRDRSMGRWELLTDLAIAGRFPGYAARVAADELRYRPPDGESLLDVATRLAPPLGEWDRDHAGRRVLLVAHDAVVLMLRYLIDGLTLERLRAVSRAGLVANGSLTRWRRDGGRLVLAEYGTVAHLAGT